MDFKAALLKSQPCTAVMNTLKPSAADGKPDGKKERNARPADSFNASGDEGRINVVKRARNRSRRRHLDSNTLPSRRVFDCNMLPTIIETGPTPPMISESPCVEAWSYVSPQGRPALTALQGIALRARDRLATRIQAEFVRQTKSAGALDRIRDQVFAQLQCQLDVVTAPTPAQSTVAEPDTPLSSTNANGLNIQLKDTQAKDEEIAHLKEALEKEREKHAKTTKDLTTMSGALVQLRDELGVYRRRMIVLEKEKEEIALKVQEQEATIQAFGKPRIPLSRSSSTSSSCTDSDHVLSSSSVSSVSPTSSERELAFSTFSTLVLRRNATASPAGSLAPPKPTSLAHRRGSSLQHTPTKSGLGPRPLNNASNVVSSEYGYLSFTIPSKGADSKVADPASTATPVASFDLTARL